ncbi:hypothetical protein F5972_06715 [Microbispora cellulosiformans]|uniref:Uncharacterized protein n=1 Tax=Microbispora cellulosiformans TaxID=2614688 RepID=A0A5J5K8I4_9ACTN|nr:hypothetical protein [Microbispora cellulosiformans]KAA9380786.1 hypothetical protein F5972_06715 [Microbispora cellulosiformans]
MSSPTNERPPYAGEPGPDEQRRGERCLDEPCLDGPCPGEQGGRRPPSTLLLREVPAHAGAPGAEILGPALPLALREVPSARCRVYVLADLAGPAAAAPLAAALLETAEPSCARISGRDTTGDAVGDTAGDGRWALLRALAVAPPDRDGALGGGLVRRLLDDLLMELRADGIRAVVFRTRTGDGTRDGTGDGPESGFGDAAMRALLEDAGFAERIERTGHPFTGEDHRTSEYDEPEIRLGAVWLVREL